MYPKIIFKGQLHAAKLIQNTIYEPKSPPIILFSGGVDASFTMLGNIAVKPILTTIWGADFFFYDDKSWESIRDLNKSIAIRFGLDYEEIKSMFRLFVNYDTLDAEAIPLVNDNWWHDFQHGLGLIGLTAPLAWVKQSKSVFISSSYSSKDPYSAGCASHPAIDEAVHFFGVNVTHYSFTANRQDKVEYICKMSDLTSTLIPLRVCWSGLTASNCGKCEKCLRTIFAIYAEDHDPGRFNFDVSKEAIESMIRAIDSPNFQISPLMWDELIVKLEKSSNKNLPAVRALVAKITH